MWLLRHRRILGCNIDTVCFKESLYGVLQVFARQIINKDSDIFGKADGPTATKILVSAIDSISARRKKLSWEASQQFCLTQSFPASIPYFLSNHFRESSI